MQEGVDYAKDTADRTAEKTQGFFSRCSTVPPLNMTLLFADKQRAAYEAEAGQALMMSHVTALLFEHVIYNAVLYIYNAVLYAN